MTLNPGKLDWREVKETAEENNLSVVLVCTGEIFGQLGLSYTCLLYTSYPMETLAFFSCSENPIITPHFRANLWLAYCQFVDKIH